MSPAGVDSVMKGALNHKCGDKVTGIRDAHEILNPNVFLGASELNIKRPLARTSRSPAPPGLRLSFSLSRCCISLKALAVDSLTLFLGKRRREAGLVVAIPPRVPLNTGPSVCKQP